MTVYAYPSGRDYVPSSMDWGSSPLVRRSSSIFSGKAQILQRPGGAWFVTLTYPVQKRAQRGIIAGLFLGLSGGAHKVAIYDFDRPTPLGTINRTGVTCSAAAQFAESLTLNGCGAGTTMEPEDKLSVSGQLFVVVAKATANGSGVMTVDVRHMVRAAITGGAAVTLDKPTSKFIPADPRWSAPRGAAGYAPAMTIELIEDF